MFTAFSPKGLPVDDSPATHDISDSGTSMTTAERTQPMPPSADSEQSVVGSGVLLREVGRNTSALRHGQPLAASPLADARRFTGATAAPTAAAARPRVRGRPPSPPPAARDADEARQPLPQLRRVLVAQVDLVRRAVEGELQ